MKATDLGNSITKLTWERKNKGLHKILVEVKSFIAQSKAYEFHRALGQHNSYVIPLTTQEPDRELFVAVPEAIFDTFFQKELIQKTVEH